MSSRYCQKGDIPWEATANFLPSRLQAVENPESVAPTHSQLTLFFPLSPENNATSIGILGLRELGMRLKLTFVSCHLPKVPSAIHDFEEIHFLRVAYRDHILEIGR